MGRSVSWQVGQVAGSGQVGQLAVSGQVGQLAGRSVGRLVR